MKSFVIVVLLIIFLYIIKCKSLKLFDNDQKFIIEIEKEFSINGRININEIEEKLFLYKSDNLSKNYNVINIGFTLDPGFILQTMITLTSIMATQNKTTKIIFHLGVTGHFTPRNMLKIYGLRRKINNLTEFNFYYLKGAVEKMKHFHPSGEACPGKFELPELLSNNIERLLIFDAGDVLVFRDLTELYNYNMKDYWVVGASEPLGIQICSKYKMTKYINIGSILLNVKELKNNHFWANYTKNRNIELFGAPDQALFNILVPDEKKDYFPLRLGGLAPIKNDQDFDSFKFNNLGLIEDLMNKLGTTLEISKYYLLSQLYNAVFIHQFDGKWKNGSGLSIYRNLAKYFINLAGIRNELCKVNAGYCD
jgi:hypothetical protein